MNIILYIFGVSSILQTLQAYHSDIQHYGKWIHPFTNRFSKKDHSSSSESEEDGCTALDLGLVHVYNIDPYRMTYKIPLAPTNYLCDENESRINSVAMKMSGKSCTCRELNTVCPYCLKNLKKQHITTAVHPLYDRFSSFQEAVIDKLPDANNANAVTKLWDHKHGDLLHNCIYNLGYRKMSDHGKNAKKPSTIDKDTSASEEHHSTNIVKIDEASKLQNGHVKNTSDMKIENPKELHEETAVTSKTKNTQKLVKGSSLRGKSSATSKNGATRQNPKESSTLTHKEGRMDVDGRKKISTSNKGGVKLKTASGIESSENLHKNGGFMSNIINGAKEKATSGLKAISSMIVGSENDQSSATLRKDSGLMSNINNGGRQMSSSRGSTSLSSVIGPSGSKDSSTTFGQNGGIIGKMNGGLASAGGNSISSTGSINTIDIPGGTFDMEEYSDISGNIGFRHMTLEDDMDVGETINLERVVEPSLSRKPSKRHIKPTILKNYVPLEPIAAENDFMRPKQKRQMNLSSFPLPKNSHPRSSSSPFNYRKNINSYTESKHQMPMQPSFLTNKASIIHDSSEEELLKFIRNNNNQMNNNVHQLDQSIESQDMVEKRGEDRAAITARETKNRPKSIYLNKIVTKRCNEDETNFPSFTIQNVGPLMDDGQKPNHKSNRDLNNIDSTTVNQSEDKVFPSNTNNQRIECKTFSSGQSGENRDSKCVPRPAFADLYGYSQHLTQFET